MIAAALPLFACLALLALLGLAACSGRSPEPSSNSSPPTTAGGNSGSTSGVGSNTGAPGDDAASGAGSGADASDGADGGGATVFQSEPPSVYVAKIKNVLVGLAPTDAEVKTVSADPAQLKTLIDGWMTLPQYTQKMLTFFELAFQQTQIGVVDFNDQTFPRQAIVNSSLAPLFLQNSRESFARTVLELAAEGRPFTETMTTQRLMMTPALMEFYAFLDAWQVDDAGKVTDRFKRANPSGMLTIEAAQGPIPIAESVDPTSPNYMHWYDPDLANAKLMVAGCVEDPIVYPAAADTLHYILYGSLLTRKSAAGVMCGQIGGSATAPQLTSADFNTWKMVTLRPPAAGEQPTAFYDLPTLRSATQLVVTVPRVGFFSTPAFFANWQTNTSNQMRVTMNQTLIVATGAAVDGSDLTVPSSTPGLDAAHSTNAACVFCHRTLDPSRSIFASTFSWNYHTQTESTYAGQKGLFAFQGVEKSVSSVADLGATLASHPLLPSAWAQKLCYYVNSSKCEPDDPEFARVVGVFQSSGYSWNALVRELLSSPLTTYAAATKTAADNGEVVGVSRRDHLCAALNFRLGLTDVCGLDALTKAAARTTVPEIVSGLPSDGYGRGGVAPVLPNAPTLFYQAGTENICEAVAALVIDPPANAAVPGAKQWSSQQPAVAVADFIQLLMGFTASDPRAAPAQALLSSHFQAAVQSGATASNALKSTFVAACLAPSAVSIGL
jgi:hypothetical protein